MSEPSYAESYELRELESRVELLEALHAGGLTVVEQHKAMLKFLRTLSRYLDSKDIRKILIKEDLKGTKKEVDELLAWIDG